MSNNLVFVGTPADKDYLSFLKPMTKGIPCFIYLKKIETLTELSMYCRKKGITGVISTSQQLLAKLLHWSDKKLPSLANYSGSFFEHEGLEIVFVNPLKHCVTVSYGKFLLRRYVSKLVEPDEWLPEFVHQWSIAAPENIEAEFAIHSTAVATAVDIETFRKNASIRCISFSSLLVHDGTMSIHTTVIPLDEEFFYVWIKRFCWDNKAPKIFQNGKYDINYLMRYNIHVYNYVFDTANMMHCWYAELPKDLANLTAFFMRKSMYWKDLANTLDLHEYYRYNALDTLGTLIACIGWLTKAPKWAKDNYYLEFPTVFPCIMAEMRGIKRDMKALETARAEQDKIDEEVTARLRYILGVPNFNPKSPKQCLQVLKLLGCKDFKSSDDTHLDKAAFMHPFNGLIVDLIKEARGARTLKSKYLQVGEDAKEFNGRILYALNPHGTDTSRLASKEHHFWCGLQVQNMPRGKEVKQTFIADEGFLFAEADLEQAESRDTAYISGEERLIDAVENSPDFHSSNASMFFGVPFEKIYDVESGKVIDKDLRQLAKPVNHGANYNMMATMLLITMGQKAVLKAKRLLGLPKVWSLKEVCHYLLEDCFHKTYPGIRGTFYRGMVQEVLTTNMLASKAVHWSNIPSEEDGYDIMKQAVERDYDKYLEIYPAWTRYCFGDPTKSKPVMNAYVAHPPQSLNAQTLNKAWLKVFFTIAINPKYADHFKLLAQVHDSILFQYRIGHEYLCDMVAECMEIPVTIRAYDDKVRTFMVPAECKNGTEDNPSTHWSKC